jgi:hypothetical protein
MDGRPNAARRTGADGPSTRELLRESRRLSEDFTALADAASHVASGWQALVRAQLARQPYATLAVATGVGYVLGGGVPTAVVRALAGLGGRWAVERAIARFIVTPSQ